VKWYSKSLLSREKATDTFLVEVNAVVSSTVPKLSVELEALRKYNHIGDAHSFLLTFEQLREALQFYSQSRKRKEDAQFVESVHELLDEFDFIEARWGALVLLKDPLGYAVDQLWTNLGSGVIPPTSYVFSDRLDVIFSDMRRELTPIWGARTASEIHFERLLETINELDELVTNHGNGSHRQVLETFHSAFDHIEAQLMILEVVDA